MSIQTGLGNYTVVNHTMSDAQMLVIQSRFEARQLEQDKKIADQQVIIGDLNKCMLALLEKGTRKRGCADDHTREQYANNR